MVILETTMFVLVAHMFLLPEQSWWAPSGCICPRSEQTNIWAATKGSRALQNGWKQQTWNFTQRARWQQVHAKPTWKQRKAPLIHVEITGKHGIVKIERKDPKSFNFTTALILLSTHVAITISKWNEMRMVTTVKKRRLSDLLNESLREVVYQPRNL